MKPREFSSIQRQEGITGAERYLKKLCDRTFLSLWSYSGVYRNQSSGGGAADGKELCDLLVVFENHIIIFSDKDCVFPDTGNLKRDWSRWFRRAIVKSAEQVWGAERWLREHPDRVFVDRECVQPLPIRLPATSDAIIHRIVVAHGSVERCQRAFHGGSGSLIIAPHIVGDEHYIEERCEPFAVGIIDGVKGFVHVFDDTSLDILLKTLDTITDFVGYLLAKEELIQNDKLIGAAGEEELLGYYLRHLTPAGEHGFVFAPDVSMISLTEGIWEDFSKHPQRKAQKEANRISYGWDELIERFSTHILGGTQHFTTHPGDVATNERIIRFLAREPRTRRRLLARAFVELDNKSFGLPRAARVIRPSSPGDPYYVFLILDKPDSISYDEYRKGRFFLLEAYCRVLKLRYPDALDIVGIACNSMSTGSSSEDAAYYNARNWSQEDADEAERLHHELGLLTDVTEFSSVEKEYPDIEEPPASTVIPRRHIGRNALCPCGSGEKYKRCCLGKQ